MSNLAISCWRRFWNRVENIFMVILYYILAVTRIVTATAVESMDEPRNVEATAFRNGTLRGLVIDNIM